MITYPVNDVYASVQGEGSLCGVPMVLLRLQGCSVGCGFCDTKETWKLNGRRRKATFLEAQGQNPYWCTLPPEDICALICAAARGTEVQWVLLTGGEPTEHPLGELVASLRRKWKVAVETSGTGEGLRDVEVDWVCLSPKLHNSGLPVLPYVVEAAHEFKFVVGTERDLAKVRGFVETHRAARDAVCLQPMSCSPSATDLCTQVCIQKGWRLSVQLHKYVGVR